MRTDEAVGVVLLEPSVARATEPAMEPNLAKVSPGARESAGGALPGAKVTPETAEARGVPPWTECESTASHVAFSTPVQMRQCLEKLRTLSGGKSTSFKQCIGHPCEWFAIRRAMLETGIVPESAVVDGAKGGTGAAPLEFTDHVGAPMPVAAPMTRTRASAHAGSGRWER